MRLAFAAAWLALASGGCADDPARQGCPPGDLCPGQRIPPPPQPQTWALELIPHPDLMVATTEVPGVTFANEPPRVALERKVKIVGAVEYEPDADLSPTATLRAVLTMASSIPGRGDRVFEGVGSGRAGRPFEFSLELPMSALGAAARLTIFPDPPLDRALPPWTTPIARVAPEITTATPRVAELWAIEGTLQDAVNVPVAGYVARARVGATTVSTIAVTAMTTGRFRLEIPLPPRSIAPVDRVQVELAPTDARDQRPFLLVDGVDPTGSNLGVLRLPSDMLRLQTFLIPVTAGGKRVSGAILRFQTTVRGAVGATAVFRREAFTDSRNEQLGKATVDLLPGTPTEPREYTVAIIPPANASFGVHCRRYTVGSGGGAPTGATIEVPLKVELSGSIVTAEGSPSGDVRVWATRIPGPEDEACSMTLVSPSSSALSAKDGSFSLLLDPNRLYRVEYRPPSGGRSPSLVEEVTLAAASKRRITLPPGVVLEGLARGPDDLAVAGCEVRAWGPGPTGLVEERGRARTGSEGRFRIVLPLKR